MMERKSQMAIVTMLLMLASLCSCSKKDVSGPFFGNGLHNGWADQSSVVIWTRLTQEPEGNTEGTQFLAIDKALHKKLDAEAIDEEIHKAQIPEGLSLDDMLGACSGASGEVRLSYFPSGKNNKKVGTKWAEVDSAENFTHQWKLEDLKAGCSYEVLIEARKSWMSGVTSRVEGRFQTAPPEDAIEDIEFMVVTCHDYWRIDTAVGHVIYESMQDLAPDFYVHTGDVEYYDKPLPYAMTEELMRFKWDRLFALPLQREFWAQTTSYFMKDDHDVLRDDAYPDLKYGSVSWERGLEIFGDEQFPSHDKFYKTIRWGKDLQVWITEGRNYRSRNDMEDGPGKTIFGKEQKEWLFRTLEESDASFKVIINANPILGPDRVRKNDNYSNAGFQTEGDEIRAFLNRFENVYLCNGDRHWQYVTHLEDTNLWEFSCGAGADIHAGGWSQSDFMPEHRFLRVKGGFLRGVVSRENDVPIIYFQHMDVYGKVMHEERFSLQ